MSESLIHHSYVEIIYQKVKSMIPEKDICFLKADLFDCDKPSLIYGSFVPDVMYCYNGLLIIGEAKTFDDYDRKHSYKQYESYMQECQMFPGETYIVICIPWAFFISAKNHFKLLKQRYCTSTKVIVLTDNGWEAII